MTDKTTEIANLKNTINELLMRVNRLQAADWPRKGDAYWARDVFGRICKDIWMNCALDNTAQALGNIYRTKEDVERELDRLRLMVELKAFADYVPDWSDGSAKYLIRKDTDSEAWSVDWCPGWEIPNTIYFKSPRRAHEAIEHFGDRLNLLLGGQDERRLRRI